MAGIVVDGSDTARHALRWAVEEARLRTASLDVIHAWHIPYVGGYPYTAAAFDPTTFEDAARVTLDAAFDGIEPDELGDLRAANIPRWAPSADGPVSAVSTTMISGRRIVPGLRADQEDER